MNLIIKIAWRNVMRHRGKSLIIGVILFLGALLMTVGNGIISGMDKGLRENIVNGFTGNILLVSDKQESDNVFIEFMGKAVEPIHNFVEIKKVLEQQQYVEKFLPVGKNMAMLLNDHKDGAPGYSFIIGVDFDQYQRMFPDNMISIEGRLLEKGERGTIIPTGARKEFYDITGIWFIPEKESLNVEHLTDELKKDASGLIVKDNIVFMGFSNDNTSSDIRLGVKGVTKYRALNTIWGHFIMMDIESYRQCLGYFAAEDKTTELSGEEKALFELENDGLDGLFTDGSLIVEDVASVVQEDLITLESQPIGTLQTANLDEGAYNLVMVKLKRGIKEKAALAQINETLKKENLGVRAISWKKAMGMIGSMAQIIKGALFTFVMFLFFVAIIIIVNTLSMAALERTSEIGMMRAIGARKSFVRKMFLGETGLLSFSFGGAGIATGVIIVNILSMLQIKSDNDIVQLLFGGDTFSPMLSAGDITVAIIQLALVTLIAVVYPIKVAGNITPLDAISRE